MAFSEKYAFLVYALYNDHPRHVGSNPFGTSCSEWISEEDGHRWEAVMHS